MRFLLPAITIVGAVLGQNALGGTHEWNRSEEDRCIMCHTSADQNPDGTASCTSCHSGHAGPSNAAEIPGITPNSHPVDRAYPSAPGYRRASEAAGRGIHLQAGNIVCTSCHDPHRPETPALLRINNQKSALCFACHDL